MKRSLSIILSLLMIASIITCTSISALADDQWVYDDTSKFSYEVLSDKTAVLCVYGGSEKSVTVPSTIAGYKVTKLDSNMYFENSSTMTSITIPTSVTEIGHSSFYNCSSLTDVYYKGSRTQWDNIKIGYSNDSLLDATIHFQSSGTKHKHTWDSGTVIKKATTSLNGIISYKCKTCGAEKVVVTSIKSKAVGSTFYYNTYDEGTYKPYKIKFEVTGDHKVSLVGAKDTSITTLNVEPVIEYYDDSVKYEEYTYNGETIGLNGISEYIVTSIGKAAFRGYSKLKTVTIGSKVTTIGSKAFAKCPSLKSVSGCAGVKTIGDYAFYNDASLTNVNNSTKTTKIGSKAFANCTSLVRVGTSTGVTTLSKLTSIGNFAFYKCTSLTTVKIPSGVTKIGTKVFTRCTSLKSVTGCSAVKSIGSCAFYNCKSMTYISGCKKLTTLGNKAFTHCTSLLRVGSTKNTVTLPKVETIGSYSFYNCKSLTKVNISSAALTTIGQDAFRYCSSLTTFSESSTKLNSIGRQTFYEDGKLSSVTFKTSKLTSSNVGAKTFEGIKTTCTFKVPSGKKSSYKKIFTKYGASSKITVKNI